MDIDFNKDSNTLTLRLSKEDSLHLLQGIPVETTESFNLVATTFRAITLSNQAERYQSKYPIGSEQQRRAVGRKACKADISVDLITVTVPKTLIAANLYTRDVVADKNRTVSESALFNGTVEVAFELFESKDLQPDA